MNTGDDQPQDSGSSWRWILIGLILGFLLWSRLTPDDSRWDSPDGPSAGSEGLGQYAGPQTRYEPGTYGDFWAREEAAEQGEPVQPSPGLRPEPATGADQVQIEKLRLEAEVERLRAENARLKLEAEAN